MQRTTTKNTDEMETGVIDIARDLRQFSESYPFLQFSTEATAEILETLKNKSKTMASTLKKAKFSNDAQQDEKIKRCILDLLQTVKPIFDYRHDKAKQLYYLLQFKAQFCVLTNCVGEEHIVPCLQQFYMAEGEEDFLRAIALAYYEAANLDATLESFRLSELIGHVLAYKIAQNENQYQRFVIKDHAGQVIRAYQLKEIVVEIKTGQATSTRDKKLMGCILIPEIEEGINEKPVLYVTWAGTYSTDTLLADFERSAGEESYRRGEDQILEQVVTAIHDLAKKTGQSVEVVTTGHSLGAALAQLCYHSLQRILALSIENTDIHKTVCDFEHQFTEALDRCMASFKLSLHQPSLAHIKLAINEVSGMRADVWNDTSVLEPVSVHTNQLSTLLVQQAGISQSAGFGQVGGDIVQKTGQARILNDVANNLANVTILKLEPNTTRMGTSVLGLMGGGFSGAIIGGAIGFPVAGGILLALTTGVAFFSTKLDAHMMKHFDKTYYPQIPFHLYTSRLPDGSLNEDKELGFKRVANELGSQSDILNIGSKVISHYVPSSSHLRFQSDTRYQRTIFQQALQNADKLSDEKENAEALLALLISHVLTHSAGSEERVLDLVRERGLINAQDDKGKTLLHHAIEANRFYLAEQLLQVDDVQINWLDKEGQSPLLLLMQKLNTAFGASREAYTLGKRLLEKGADVSCVNQRGESVASIFKTWHWRGYYSADFSRMLTQQLAQTPSPSPRLT